VAPPKPLVEPTPVSAPFWDSLAENRICIQYSPSAEKYVFYPRVLSPGTLHDDLEWREITGNGTLYSFTVVDRPPVPEWVDTLPQLLAIIEWDEGPRVSTELVDVETDHLEIGMRVRPVFCHQPEGPTLLRYTRDRR
jgi:uncharacterized OB-fold protein